MKKILRYILETDLVRKEAQMTEIIQHWQFFSLKHHDGYRYRGSLNADGGEWVGVPRYFNPTFIVDETICRLI